MIGPLSPGLIQRVDLKCTRGLAGVASGDGLIKTERGVEEWWRVQLVRWSALCAATREVADVRVGWRTASGVSLRTLLSFDLADSAGKLRWPAGPAVAERFDVPMWW
jgi:hypothetical protein